jgi:hypothetical protein
MSTKAQPPLREDRATTIHHLFSNHNVHIIAKKPHFVNKHLINLFKDYI